ncbi:MAG TPA: ABC transporter permease subunit [Aestuariivirgaceae bacterium]|jgi:glycine betaine/proline transport system permease protein
MSLALPAPHGQRAPALQSPQQLFLLLLAVIVSCLIASTYLAWVSVWPSAWVVPARQWVTDFFAWLGKDAALGPIAVVDITRFISWLLSLPLGLVEALLYRGVLAYEWPPLPWVAIVAGTAILAHWIGGTRLAVFCGLAALYLAIFQLWPDAMQTLAIVMVAVPLAAGIGLFLGIWATKSKRVEAIVTAAFDIMQATPHMAYLGPVVVLFGFGKVPALLATLIFAMPPMARCVVLGIATVPTEVVEAGRMAGCTPRQLLWKVQLPAAKKTLLLGLNQVVMQTLAMVVIASLVGASGLGQKLLFSLQQLYIGKATEQGIAITLIAVVLDRMTQAYAYRGISRFPAGTSWSWRHRHLLTFIAILILTIVAARFVPALAVLPKQFTVSYGPVIDTTVRWISKNFYEYIKPARDWITVFLLLPLRDFYLWMPWTMVVGVIGVLGWHFGGWRLAALTVLLLLAMLLTGYWVPLMLTVYLVSAATVISIMIGIPIGVWASRSERVARVVLAVCDTLQTFPSFIYLIPVIMLLKVGDLSNIAAILGYASVPAIRFTYLGIRRIPAVIIEAANAAGATPLQRLWKVELPVAMPEIMLGINQTIMMALAMVAITALIGSRDLGQEIYKALPGADTGRGLLAGLGIAFIGIIADRLIGAWAANRKKELGMA